MLQFRVCPTRRSCILARLFVPFEFVYVVQAVVFGDDIVDDADLDMLCGMCGAAGDDADIGDAGPGPGPVACAEMDAVVEHDVGGDDGDRDPIVREAPDLVFQCEGGSITFYRKSGNFAATCDNVGHIRCILTRKGGTSKRTFGSNGRPLGCLIAWLAQNDQLSHNAHMKLRPTFNARQTLRRLYRASATFREFEQLERLALRPDEGSEPDECAIRES